ncbi:MAG: protein ImuB [Actinomycetota bacterium]|nr:protein ImuB [Actinomycetota bacterium]
MALTPPSPPASAARPGGRVSAASAGSVAGSAVPAVPAVPAGSAAGSAVPAGSARSAAGSAARPAGRASAASAGSARSAGSPRDAPVRTVAVWCPDWPVAAAAAAEDLPPHVPIAIVADNRVVACSAIARADGVRRGLRRREAQSRCPELVVLAADPGRDARFFEPVVAAVESLAPGVEIVRPGVVVVPARGPVRYFGGDEAVAERLVDHVAGTGTECQVGIADGVFASVLAARRGLVVAAGGTAGFLGPLDIGELDLPGESEGGGRGTASGGTRTADRAELVDLLRRLGLRTLGAFAALPVRDVVSRFSADAALAHRLARGLDPRPPSARRPPADLTVSVELDPPVDRIDAAAFAARSLAEQLHEVLSAHGLACTRLGIEAETGNGEHLLRTWRHEGALGAADIADRVRWQLEGWLTGRNSGRPTAEVTRLHLVPEEVVSRAGLQLGLWGGLGESGERAHRALTRVQGMLGPEAVLTAVLGGGRGPGDQVRLVPWKDERTPALPAEAPWPGRLPTPAPATVLPEPLAADVRDASGTPVGVTGRHAVTAPPAELGIGGKRRPVLAWAGPWPADERWWDAAAARRRARFQVVVAGDVLPESDGDDGVEGTALLLVLEGGRWWVEAVYD